MKKSEIGAFCDAYVDMFPDEGDNFYISSAGGTSFEKMTITVFVINSSAQEVFLVSTDEGKEGFGLGEYYQRINKDYIREALKDAKESIGFEGLEIHPWHIKNNFLPIDIEIYEIPDEGNAQKFSFELSYVFVLKDSETNLLGNNEKVLGGNWVSFLSDIEELQKKRILEKIRDIAKPKISLVFVYSYLFLGIATTILLPYLCYLWLDPHNMTDWIILSVTSFVGMIVFHFIGTILLFSIFGKNNKNEQKSNDNGLKIKDSMCS